MKNFWTIFAFLLFFPESAHADTVSIMGFKAHHQEKSNWCWAASIQSILLTKGLEVTQSNIVTAAYGAPVNRTAPGFIRTLGILDGLSVSTDGGIWKINASAGNSFPNANWLYSELQNNTPVMIWYKDNTSNHSIVINGGKYTKDGYGNIYWQQITAYDPWRNRNMKIDAANIPKYVYGSFLIELKRLDISDDAPWKAPNADSPGDKEANEAKLQRQSEIVATISRENLLGVGKEYNPTVNFVNNCQLEMEWRWTDKNIFVPKERQDKTEHLLVYFNEDIEFKADSEFKQLDEDHILLNMQKLPFDSKTKWTTFHNSTGASDGGYRNQQDLPGYYRPDVGWNGAIKFERNYVINLLNELVKACH